MEMASELDLKCEMMPLSVEDETLIVISSQHGYEVEDQTSLVIPELNEVQAIIRMTQPIQQHEYQDEMMGFKSEQRNETMETMMMEMAVKETEVKLRQDTSAIV